MTAVIAPSVTFASFGLDERLVAALTTLGYEEPTPIQREAIPSLIAGRDLLGQAATGTGKTAAFALPILQRLAAAGASTTRAPRALVLVPTRELAMQVAEAVHRYGKGIGARVTSIYGGQDIARQFKTLQRGVDVVVATPGRALDHMRRKTLVLDAIEVVVLDEADEMLDMGFAEDIEAILQATPKTRQTALFSATIPDRIAAIARRHLRDPIPIRIAHEPFKEGTKMPRVRQTAYIVARAHKVAALVRILDVEQPTMALIFCRTRLDVDELTERLNSGGNTAEPLHGGMSQEQRDRVMKKFRAGTAELLIATDVAARGLDVKGLSHVVNYDVPSAPEDYVHRIGRTGRAGREGVAITLCEPKEHRLLRNIEHQTRQRIEIATIPSVADLRARKLEVTRASLRETLAAAAEGNELDRFRVVVDSLTAEYDIVDVAMAAIKLAHVAAGGDRDEDEAEIPSQVPTHKAKDHKPGSKPSSKGPFTPSPEPEKFGAGVSASGKKTPRKQTWKAAKLFVGAGFLNGVRANDLVGAIANECGLPSTSIGAITISERFSIVEIPEDVIDKVVSVLKNKTVKGKKVTVRRDRDE